MKRRRAVRPQPRSVDPCAGAGGLFLVLFAAPTGPWLPWSRKRTVTGGSAFLALAMVLLDTPLCHAGGDVRDCWTLAGLGSFDFGIIDVVRPGLDVHPALGPGVSAR